MVGGGGEWAGKGVRPSSLAHRSGGYAWKRVAAGWVELELAVRVARRGRIASGEGREDNGGGREGVLVAVRGAQGS